MVRVLFGAAGRSTIRASRPAGIFRTVAPPENPSASQVITNQALGINIRRRFAEHRIANCSSPPIGGTIMAGPGTERSGRSILTPVVYGIVAIVALIAVTYFRSEVWQGVKWVVSQTRTLLTEWVPNHPGQP